MTDVRGARICAMLADPDLGGDLLLVGLGVARFLDLGTPSGVLSTGHVADACWPASTHRHWRVQDAIRSDARRYLPPTPPRDEQVCQSPMTRRDGICGHRPVWRSGCLHDWVTGEMTWSGACRRHDGWVARQHAANYAARPPEGQRVLPPANSGGALVRHLPELDWPTLWRWADPTWVEHPEREPWRPPTLTLHLGAAEPEPGRAVARPVLVPAGGP